MILHPNFIVFGQIAILLISLCLKLDFFIFLYHRMMVYFLEQQSMTIIQIMKLFFFLYIYLQCRRFFHFYNLFIEKIMNSKSCVFVLLALVLSNCTFPENPIKQLIKNGNFADNCCKSQFCVSKDPNLVPGWIPDPQIQIGYGSLYSQNLGNQRVLELAANTNTCVRQQIPNLQAGAYQLKISYAARKGRTFQDCQFSISLNGQSIKTFLPKCYDVQTEVIQFSLRYPIQVADLRICGFGGQNNAFGSIIKSVSLIRKQNIQISVQQPTSQTGPFTQIPALETTPTGIYINSHVNKCFQRQYKLQNGEHQLDLDYKIISSQPVHQSYLIVNFNGKIVQKLYPSEHLKTIKISLNVNQLSNILTFCPVGYQYQVQHQIYLSNIYFLKKQCTSKWSNDLIVNGKFQDNDCKLGFCLWSFAKCKESNPIPGWVGEPQIQIGTGYLYNSAFGKNIVAQLDANGNTCIRQNLSLKNGKYVMNFDWANRFCVLPDSSSFDVKVNGQVIKSFVPKAHDYSIKKQKLQFVVDSKLNNSPTQYVQFCGTGKSNWFGALVTNIQLYYFNECDTFSWVNY